MPERQQDQAPGVPTPPMPTLPGGSILRLCRRSPSWRKPGRFSSILPPAPGARAGAAPSRNSRRIVRRADIRRDFPILREHVNGRPLIWLDNAATTQKPQSVIDRLAISTPTRTPTSTAPRTNWRPGPRMPTSPRAKRSAAFSTPPAREIIFVRGATEGINLVAQSWGRQNIHKDDEIVITWLEHHANIVPWQMLCAEKAARLRVAPVDDRGQVDPGGIREAAGPAHTAGLRSPRFPTPSARSRRCSEMIEAGSPAWRAGAGRRRAGGVAHARRRAGARLRFLRVLRATRCSRPPGIGVVYGKSRGPGHDAALAGRRQHDPGRHLRADRYQPPPARFEAGTGNIADAVGLGAAIDYLDRSAWPTSPPRTRTAGVRDRSAQRSPACASSARPRKRRAYCRSCLTASARRKSASFSTGRHRRPGRPPLRPAHTPALRRRKHGARFAGALQHLRGHRCTGLCAAAHPDS